MNNSREAIRARERATAAEHAAKTADKAADEAADDAAAADEAADEAELTAAEPVVLIEKPKRGRRKKSEN